MVRGFSAKMGEKISALELGFDGWLHVLSFLHTGHWYNLCQTCSLINEVVQYLLHTTNETLVVWKRVDNALLKLQQTGYKARSPISNFDALIPQFGVCYLIYRKDSKIFLRLTSFWNTTVDILIPFQNISDIESHLTISKLFQITVHFKTNDSGLLLTNSIGVNLNPLLTLLEPDFLLLEPPFKYHPDCLRCRNEFGMERHLFDDEGNTFVFGSSFFKFLKPQWSAPFRDVHLRQYNVLDETQPQIKDFFLTRFKDTDVLRKIMTPNGTMRKNIHRIQSGIPAFVFVKTQHESSISNTIYIFDPFTELAYKLAFGGFNVNKLRLYLQGEFLVVNGDENYFIQFNLKDLSKKFIPKAQCNENCFICPKTKRLLYSLRCLDENDK